MTTKTGWLDDGGRIFMKLWDLISEGGYKFHHHYSQYIGSRKVRKNWWRKLLWAWIGFWIVASVWVFWYMNSQAYEKRKETLASMCDERARMLQDQFNEILDQIASVDLVLNLKCTDDCLVKKSPGNVIYTPQEYHCMACSGFVPSFGLQNDPQRSSDADKDTG